MIGKAKELYRLYKEDDLGHHAAATAYYALFALTPFLIVLLSISGVLLGTATTDTYIITYLRTQFGVEIVGAVQTTADRLAEGQADAYFAIAGILIFLYAVVKFFEEIRRIFFRIFKIRMYEKNVIKRTVKQRIFAGIYMIVSLALVIVFTAVNIGFSAVKHLVEALSITLVPLFHTLQFAITFVVVAVLFGTLYRVASGGAISRMAGIFGGAVAGIGMLFINGLFALFIQFSTSFHAYGAAGFLIALMLWLYYASLAVYVGAEASKVAGS